MHRRPLGVPARRPALVVAALAAALTLAGCAGSGVDSPVPAAPEASTAAAPADADVAFVRGMTPHHDQALQMTALAPDRASSPRVTALASEISAAQQPEITTMRDWLSARGLPATDPAHAGHAMTGMLDATALQRLEASRGPAFDRLFLEQMVAHHAGALEMARTEVATGRDPQMVALARDIVASQQAEIDRMRAMLG
ncbi:uncharacterized protein (DUF305 family) [Pseudonocardia sediminis]|uniref:Uncharacterized protein (DUF305 family) n=1 Tax=Pseudonocardia sediminis TaxID=1397368 RepID=A0A4Q7UX65_PSEST|nr:DUF305 domain-containing protein [Pseudonocardia sediminis]RZT86365.1 uncharacterized protein (DUF305 family) [Pseudonocardia sediminis]